MDLVWKLGVGLSKALKSSVRATNDKETNLKVQSYTGKKKFLRCPGNAEVKTW